MTTSFAAASTATAVGGAFASSYEAKRQIPNKRFSGFLSVSASFSTADFKVPGRRNKRQNLQGLGRGVCCFPGESLPNVRLPPSEALVLDNPFCQQKVIDTISSKDAEMQNATEILMQSLVIIDLDPASAKVAIAFLGPFLSAFAFLFILRIIMSWYPMLPVKKFPYIIAYAPTEPVLVPTRRLIPPLGGVDVTPVVWFGLISFLNEILVGPQGLLVLLSQQIS